MTTPEEAEAPMPALVAIGACTVQGRRPTNEDAETALASMHAELPDHALLAVFDGHGGALAAKIAERSLLATLRLQPDYQTYQRQQADGRDPTLLGAALRAAFLALDATIVLPELASADDSSGCTAIVVIVTPTHLVCASAGDSRACFCGPDAGVVALSQDHKPADPAETQRIEAAGGCVVAGRVDGGLAVARALGDPEYKKNLSWDGSPTGLLLPPEQQKVSPEPDVVVQPRRASDQLVVVACDGNHSSSLCVFSFPCEIQNYAQGSGT